MKFIVSASNGRPIADGIKIVGKDEYGDYIYGIEINTLVELIEFKKKVDCGIIISDTYEENDYSDLEIEIYNGYRE